MCKIKKILLAVIFVFTFSIIGKAQGTTDYRFLEVVDSADKPIAAATVDLQGACSTGKQLTDEKGELKRGLPIGGGDCGSLYDFTISKNGYYSFRDIGLFSAPYNDVYREQFVSDFFRSRDKYKKDANPNLLARNFAGNCTSALMNAVVNVNPALVKLLLNNKADVNLTCGDGRNALRSAVGFESYNSNPQRSEIIKTLIDAGANVNAADKSGETNLMFAVGTNDLNAVELLLEGGAAASVNACNKRGETALMKARRLTDTADNAIFRLLVKYGADPMKSVQCQPF